MRTMILSAIVSFILIGITPSAAVNAQSSELAENQKAVLSFDFRLSDMRSSEVAKKLKLAEKIKDARLGVPGGPDLDNVKRIFGAISAPDDFGGLLQTAQGGDAPFEFFIRLEMENANSTDQFVKWIVENGEASDVGGKTFYKPNSNPYDNVFSAQVDDTTVEIGTMTYIGRSDRKVFSSKLKRAWEKSPQGDAVRIVLDLEGVSELVKVAVEQGKKAVPGNFGAFVDLLNAAADLRISMDLSSQQLLTIGATGKSESDAEEIAGGLNSLVGIGQLTGANAVKAIESQSPELGKMLGNMLKSLKAVQNGEDVILALPRPEGFEKAIEQLP